MGRRRSSGGIREVRRKDKRQGDFVRSNLRFPKRHRLRYKSRFTQAFIIFYFRNLLQIYSKFRKQQRSILNYWQFAYTYPPYCSVSRRLTFYNLLLIFFIQTSHRLTNSAYSLSDTQQHIRQPRIYHLLRHTAVLCHLWPFSSRLTNLIYNLCRILNIVCCRTN